MSKVVRSSKYRHVYGTPAKPEECYQDLRVTRSAWDANFIKANTKYFALAWEGGGGPIAVLKHEDIGKISQINPPLLAAHKRPVLDFDWHPFNEQLLASVSEDANVMVWQIPEEGITKQINEPVQTLSGHKRNVGTANFNPVADHILATSSNDLTVKLWDVEKGANVISVDGHTDIIHGVDWNFEGSQLATTCHDKKLRIFDPRQLPIGIEVLCHLGNKSSRVVWLGNSKVLTVGFSKAIDREFNIWDPRNITEPIAHFNIDTSSGGIMPFYDHDTTVLYLAGKGDGNIRYYEIVDEAPYFHYLAEFKSSTPQKGLAFLPKRSLNVNECEISRALKLHTNKVEPISFRVPRKSDDFASDLFPDAYAGEAALTAEQWLAGENAEPILRSLAPGFVPKTQPAATFNPVAQKVEEGPQTEKELRDAYEKLKTRVAYLEAEIVKKDAKIKELSA
uniref:Coronin n=1 Tax=Physarum polycephalum TaxID=5791 RepID=Q5R226_PHYPO|nr:coronin [Physarum polycephalum]